MYSCDRNFILLTEFLSFWQTFNSFDRNYTFMTRVLFVCQKFYYCGGICIHMMRAFFIVRGKLFLLFCINQGITEKYKGKYAIRNIILPFLRVWSNQYNSLIGLLHLYYFLNRQPYHICSKSCKNITKI
jgi:hypothetical protein